MSRSQQKATSHNRLRECRSHRHGFQRHEAKNKRTTSHSQAKARAQQTTELPERVSNKNNLDQSVRRTSAVVGLQVYLSQAQTPLH